MIKISHNYTLTSEWQRQLAEEFVNQIGATQIDEKLVLMPENIAEGGFYYIDVVSGISVVVWDVVFKEPILITRLESEDELFIIHYDFSDEMNLMHIEDVAHKIGYKANLGLAVFDNTIANVFQPVVGERVFSMRLLVAKELLNFPFASTSMNTHTQKSKNDKDIIFFYDHIDSKSKLIMNEVKNKAFTDPGFELYLRGISLRLFAKFIDRYSNLRSMDPDLSDKEAEALNETKEYLLNNLFNEFPGVVFLAEMAGQSVTKYKYLFKGMFVDTPNNFFNREKLFLAKELLKSEKFDTIDEVSKKLNYKTVRYFTLKYSKQFRKKPLDDFKIFK